MIKVANSAIPQLLKTLFNELLQHKLFPNIWKVAKCVPIPKPYKPDQSYPKNLRPISLLTCLAKTFENIIATLLAQEAISKGAITLYQVGSRKALSAIDTPMDTLTEAQK